MNAQLSQVHNACKSTVYMSNIPFDLTNNDLHQILGKFGPIARITIMKDKTTRLSKGVAFIHFVEEKSAEECVKEMNCSLLNDRTVKCSIAKENGRSKEFIKRREYVDKSRCFECGEEGHLSYTCPKNSLGHRSVKKKKKASKEKWTHKRKHEAPKEESEDETDTESLSFAIHSQQQKVEEENQKLGATFSSSQERKKLKIKKSSYFSDEEEESYD